MLGVARTAAKRIRYFRQRHADVLFVSGWQERVDRSKGVVRISDVYKPSGFFGVSNSSENSVASHYLPHITDVNVAGGSYSCSYNLLPFNGACNDVRPVNVCFFHLLCRKQSFFFKSIALGESIAAFSRARWSTKVKSFLSVSSPQVRDTLGAPRATCRSQSLFVNPVEIRWRSRFYRERDDARVLVAVQLSHSGSNLVD